MSQVTVRFVRTETLGNPAHSSMVAVGSLLFPTRVRVSGERESGPSFSLFQRIVNLHRYPAEWTTNGAKV